MPAVYCVYCGQIQHRCQCAEENSRLRQFLARGHSEFIPQWMPTSYKRGVPPQVKRRERATLRRNYTEWYGQLVEQFGAICQHCKAQDENNPPVLDHVLPIARGGLSELANMQLLCAECNRLKSKFFFDCRKAPD